MAENPHYAHNVTNLEKDVKIVKSYERRRAEVERTIAGAIA
jgi:hypothetical protein